MLVALDANPHRRANACISRKAGSLSPLFIWVTTSMHIYTWTGMTAQEMTLTQKLCWCPLVSSAQNPISCLPMLRAFIMCNLQPSASGELPC